MRSVVVGALLLLSGVASAAVPASVSTSLSDALADVVTVAGMVLAIAVGLMAFRWMRAALNSGGSAGDGSWVQERGFVHGARPGSYDEWTNNGGW